MKSFRTLTILLIIGLFSSNNLEAQDHYLRIYPGFAFSAAKDALEAEITPSSSTSIINSFGSGFNAGFGYGFMFNENVGIDIGVSYIRTRETTVSDIELSIGSNLTKNTAIVSSHQVRLAPALLVTSDKDKFNVYARAGLFLPVGGILSFDNTSRTDTTGNGEFDRRTFQRKKIHGSFSVGFVGAAGFDIKIKDRISVYLEAEMINLRVKYKTAEITEFTIDGVDQIPGKDVWEIEKNYVKELNSSSNNTDYNPDFDPDQPEDLLIESGPFSSLGLNAGVKIRLGKSE